MGTRSLSSASSPAPVAGGPPWAVIGLAGGSGCWPAADTRPACPRGAAARGPGRHRSTFPPHRRVDQDAVLLARVLRERIGGGEEVDVVPIARLEEVRAAL